MKFALKIYIQCATLGAHKTSQFRIISRSASLPHAGDLKRLSSCALLQRPSCVPSSFGHSRMSPLTSPSPWCHVVGPSSRLMSSDPPPPERLTLVKAEYWRYKAEGKFQLPSQLEEKDLHELAQLRSIAARRKFLRFLFINEMKSIHRKEKNQYDHFLATGLHLEMMEIEKLKPEEYYMQYGLWRNTFFLKWNKQRMNRVDCQRVLQAILYGQPIVFDYGFEQHMVRRERKVLARQMAECIGMNRDHREPFYFHFCNFKADEDLGKTMLKTVPTLLNDDFLVDVHSEDYLDLFPKDKLVYLTPNSREEMEYFDHNTVYIIGGLVELGCMEPITLAKAKKQNIKFQKLPLDRYLDWGHGSKALALNQVLGIMLEMKRSGSWVKAFTKHVPRRKLIKAQKVDPATGRLVNPKPFFKD